MTKERFVAMIGEQVVGSESLGGFAGKARVLTVCPASFEAAGGCVR